MDGSGDCVIDVLIMLLGLVFLGYCQCHSWPCNPVHMST